MPSSNVAAPFLEGELLSLSRFRLGVPLCSGIALILIPSLGETVLGVTSLAALELGALCGGLRFFRQCLSLTTRFAGALRFPLCCSSFSGDWVVSLSPLFEGVRGPSPCLSAAFRLDVLGELPCCTVPRLLGLASSSTSSTTQISGAATTPPPCACHSLTLSRTELVS